MKTPTQIQIEGHVKPGFEAVREAFAENFSRRQELGGACCVYHCGEKVVDLWGGVRNEATGEPWQEGTMVLVYSTTKGLAAMTLAVAHSRGWLDYDEHVCTYWPEFAQHGKEGVTVRQLLAHQAGLFALDEPLTRSLVADTDRLAEVLARQQPAWPPGERQAYHAITLGFYESELLRRVDPQHRSLGQFFHDEIATPLDLDFYIRLPESVPDSRLAILSRPGLIAMLRGFGLGFFFTAFNPRSNIPPARGFYDECMGTDGVQFSLGLMKHCPVWTFCSESSFGQPGTGGSLGFADPEKGIGYGYVTSRMGTYLTGDPRDIALRDALYSCIR